MARNKRARGGPCVQYEAVDVVHRTHAKHMTTTFVHALSCVFFQNAATDAVEKSAGDVIKQPHWQALAAQTYAF